MEKLEFSYNAVANVICSCFGKQPNISRNKYRVNIRHRNSTLDTCPGEISIPICQNSFNPLSYHYKKNTKKTQTYHHQTSDTNKYFSSVPIYWKFYWVCRNTCLGSQILYISMCWRVFGTEKVLNKYLFN